MSLHAHTLLYLMNALISGEHDIELPEAIDRLAPLEPVSMELAEAAPEELLSGMVKKVAASPTARSVNLMLCILHTRAARAVAEGRLSDAEQSFVWLLTVNPADPNARSALVTICDDDPHKIIRYLAPGVEALSPTIEGHRLALERGAKAAFVLDEYDFIQRLSTEEALRRQPQLRAIARRMDRLKDLDAAIPLFGLFADGAAATPFTTVMSEALKALFERKATLLLERATTLYDNDLDDRSVAIDAAVTLCAIAFSEIWPQAFRQGQALVSTLLIDEAATERMRTAWRAAGLPGAAVAAMIVDALTAAEHDAAGARLADTSEYRALITALDANRAACLGPLQDFWKEALLTGQFDRVMRLGPAGLGETRPGDEESNIILASRYISRPSDGGASVWYFLTWHEHLDRLLRLVSVLHGEKQTIVVSIGGGKQPDELGRLSTLLLLDRVHCLFRPVVTWGGPKLLYQNALEVFDAFDKRAPDGAWLNIICNRTYPLMSPNEMSRSLATPAFPEQYPSTIAPPAWRQEWPDSIVDHMATIYDAAFHSVYETCTLDEFRTLAFEDNRLNASAFNFSPRAEVLEDGFKDGSHQYSISPYSADMRWMSFGRLTEFIDTSDENNHTYTRKIPLHIMKWLQSVFSKHNMRTGDPFVSVDKGYVDKVLHNDDCVELFSAMNLGFGPEMNFIDTVAMSPQYGLRYNLGHQYYRTPLYEAVESDIGPADEAAAVDRKFFMRKTSPVISGPFIKYFSDKIGEDWSPASTLLVLDVVSDPGLPAAVMPGPRELLGQRLEGITGRLRNLKGQVIAPITFEPGGRMSAGSTHLGRWSLNETGLVADFATNNWGVRRYQKVVANADTLTLAPSEIVSARNAWGLFIDLDLSSLYAGRPAPTWIIEPQLLDDHEGHWSISRSRDAAVLHAFEREDLLDYPVPATRAVGKQLETRRVGEQYFTLTHIEDAPVLLIYEGFVFANSAGKAVFGRAKLYELEKWQDGTPIQIGIGLETKDLVGFYELDLLEKSQIIEFSESGRILDPQGKALGWWMVSRAGIQVFGVPGLRCGLVGQFQMVRGVVRLSGWGWRDVENAVTFVLRRA